MSEVFAKYSNFLLIPQTVLFSLIKQHDTWTERLKTKNKDTQSETVRRVINSLTIFTNI